MKLTVVRLSCAVIVLAACALVAAACGSSDNTSKKSSTKKKTASAKLGMDQAAVCVVYGTKISPDDVRELSGQGQDAFKLARPGVDADEVDLDGYDGELDTFDIVALDQRVEAALVDHAARKLHVDIDDEDVDDAIDELVQTAKLDDSEELMEVLSDGAGLDEDTLREAVRLSEVQKRAFRKLDADDAADFDDADEWVEDELRPRADEDGKVRCAKGVEWDEDLRDGLELPDGSTANFGPMVDTLVTTAVTNASKPDPTDMGIAYEDKVVPIINGFTPVLRRFISVFTKFNDDKIGINRIAEGMGRQVADIRALHRRAARVKVGDAYLDKNHRHLVNMLDAYAKALAAIQALDGAKSTSQVTAQEKIFTREINRASRELIAWANGLDGDPEKRPFVRTAAAATRLAETAKALS